MPRGPSARRYAQAVFQLAVEHDQLDQWLDDFGVLVGALENREFADFLDAPQVSIDDKVSVVRRSLDSSVNALALNLVCLLASRGVARLVPDIAEQYQTLLDARRGVERAEVASAVALDDQQLERVTALLADLVDRDVSLDARVDPALLGGFVARVGDRVVDGSTRTKLDRMRRSLVERA